MKRKTKKFIGILLACVITLAGITSCGKTEEEVEQITETATTDEAMLIDSEGFTPVKGYVKTLQDNTNLYIAPKDDASIYITIGEEVDLTRTGVKDGWTRILLNGGNYYVRSDRVVETDINWATETDATLVSHVIFIDPGKQLLDDSELELMSPDIDPDAVVDGAGLKAKMAPAAQGVSTGQFEYDVTLSVAEYLNAALVEKGFTVYMSRTSDGVDISNARRAALANANEAEAYIKLEAGNAADSTTHGAIGFITTSTNTSTGSNYEENYGLCYDIMRCISEDTTAERLGIYETDDLTSLNYCKMPATVINIGFLSNQYDDEALFTADYQRKMADAIARGIEMYFQED